MKACPRLRWSLLLLISLLRCPQADGDDNEYESDDQECKDLIAAKGSKDTRPREGREVVFQPPCQIKNGQDEDA
jgi:hypothetical protein